MVLSIESAELQVYHPGNESDRSPDLTIPGKHIASASISQRVHKEMDKVTFEIHNDHARYTDAVQHRDRIVFRTVLRDEAVGHTGEGYGLSSFGLDSHGGRSPPIVREWTGLIKGPIVTEYTNDYDSILSFDASDFVFGILDDRIITIGKRETPGDEIARQIVEESAPEIDTSGIGRFDQTDYFGNARNALKALIDVAEQVDGILSGHGRTISFQPRDSIEASFNLRWQDIGTLSIRYNDDNLTTKVRVDGGTAPETYDSQQTQTGYQTISQNDQMLQQFEMPKSTVAEIELWTHPTGSEANYVVRLQADDDGEPVNASETREDIAKKTLSHEFIDTDGFTTFQFPDHNAPDRLLWMIIQTEGEDQEIGINDTGTPAFRAKYKYPVAIQREGATINQYRPIEEQRKRKNISTFSAANDLAKASLEHSQYPETVVETDINSVRLHTVDPGTVLSLDFEEVGATGDFLVMQREDEYGSSAGALLSSTVKLQELATV